MTQKVYIQKLASYRNELVGLVTRLDKELSQPIDEDDAHEQYEEMRKDEVINRLSETLTQKKRSKTININTIVEWARLDENIIKTKLSPRNPLRTSTFWCVDVMKFLCDLWGRQYPESYYKACEKECINPKTGMYAL
ncbi:MAG: hypothetical protein K6F33_00290 [Bacteroidales bacterium]|nr:hypothetical protein [Bacteroidales bacterium]